MNVLDAITNNIIRLNYTRYYSSFDNKYGQIILDFPIKEKTFLPYIIRGNDLLPKINLSEYDSISIIMGIPDHCTYRTINPVMKECFHSHNLCRKIDFNDMCIYAGGGLIFGENYQPLFMLGREWKLNSGNSYALTNVCKINPEVFRVSNAVNRFIKDKLIPLFAEDNSDTFKDSYKIDIDCEILNYSRYENPIDGFTAETSKNILSHFVENTFEQSVDE